MSVCFSEDDYTRSLEEDNGQAIWQVILSSGETVTMDDARPGVSPPSAWLRLRKYCDEAKLNISQIKLKFRDRIVNAVPVEQNGYYFCKSILADMSGGASIGFYVVGWYDSEGNFFVRRWGVPDLEPLEVEQRDVPFDSEAFYINV